MGKLKNFVQEYVYNRHMGNPMKYLVPFMDGVAVAGIGVNLSPLYETGLDSLEKVLAFTLAGILGHVFGYADAIKNQRLQKIETNNPENKLEQSVH